MPTKQMELQEILSVSLGTLIVIVIAHFAVFWVVRTMYPPVMVVTQQAPTAAPVAYTPPPVIPQEQHATVPTLASPVSVEPPRESAPERRGPPPAESTSIRGESGLAPAVAQ